jgi:hypothetical protein
MDQPCPHTRKRTCVIFLEPNHEQLHPVAVITGVHCLLCGQEFEFAGVEGPGVILSADRRELRVTIVEGRRSMIQ